MNVGSCNEMWEKPFSVGKSATLAFMRNLLKTHILWKCSYSSFYFYLFILLIFTITWSSIGTNNSSFGLIIKAIYNMVLIFKMNSPPPSFEFDAYRQFKVKSCFWFHISLKFPERRTMRPLVPMSNEIEAKSLSIVLGNSSALSVHRIYDLGASPLRSLCYHPTPWV